MTGVAMLNFSLDVFRVIRQSLAIKYEGSWHRPKHETLIIIVLVP
jgi:hypothetical protein